MWAANDLVVGTLILSKKKILIITTNSYKKLKVYVYLKKSFN